MQKALSILVMLITDLPVIKQELGDHWPAFADQMRAQATLFEGLADEAALTKAANQLLALFLDGKIVEEVITRPLSERAEVKGLPGTIRHYLDNREPTDTINIPAVANIFYDLSKTADEEAARASLDQLLTKKSQPDPATEEASSKKEKQA